MGGILWPGVEISQQEQEVAEASWKLSQKVKAGVVTGDHLDGNRTRLSGSGSDLTVRGMQRSPVQQLGLQSKSWRPVKTLWKATLANTGILCKPVSEKKHVSDPALVNRSRHMEEDKLSSQCTANCSLLGSHLSTCFTFNTNTDI